MIKSPPVCKMVLDSEVCKTSPESFVMSRGGSYTVSGFRACITRNRPTAEGNKEVRAEKGSGK